MFRRLLLRRSTRTRLLRASLLILFLFTAIDILSLSRLRASIPPPIGSLQNSPSLPRKPYTGAPLLLASTHWNNAPVLTSNWTTAVLALAAYLGPSNLFVSIVESGSWDASGEILRDLDRELGKLGVGRRVLTGMEGGRSHKQELERPMGKGWVDTGGDRGRELRRVPYLAGVRNKVLEVLEEGGESGEGEGKGRVKRQKDDQGGEDGKGTKGKSKGGLKRKPKAEKQSVEAKGQSEKEEKKEGAWDWRKLGKVVWVNDVVFTVRIYLISSQTINQSPIILFHLQPSSLSIAPPRPPLLHRIPYSGTRNPNIRTKSVELTRLFSQVDDILNLIDTRDGDYAAACSMDYAKPPAYYDTFALRDIEGYEAVTSTFPYFRSKISRDAMIAGQAVPVQSCWNGMGMFPFPSHLPLSPHLVHAPLSSFPHARNSPLKASPQPPLTPHPPPSLLRRNPLPPPLLPAPHLPRHPRQPRLAPPRSLRMLPHPHRQPAHALQRRLAQPRRPRRVFPCCVSCCASQRALAAVGGGVVGRALESGREVGDDRGG